MLAAAGFVVAWLAPLASRAQENADCLACHGKEARKSGLGGEVLCNVS